MRNVFKAAVLISGTAALLAAATTYTATTIPYLPGGTSATLVHVNNNGQVCGYGGSSSGTQAFLWSSGTGTVAIGPGQARGCNDSGQVVYNDSGTIYVWTASGGTVTVGSGSAAGIGNNGQVAGTSPTRAFVWSPGTGVVTLGVLPGATKSSACGINDVGQVVGSSSGSFLYSPDSGMISIPVSIPMGLNNNGVVVGHNGYDGQLWSSATGLTLLPRGISSGGAFTESLAINDSGAVTGEAATSPTDWMGQAFVYSGGVMTNLNSVTTGLPSGVTLLEGMSINNSGQIIVWASGSPSYYLLSPATAAATTSVPALSAPALLLSALGLLLAGWLAMSRLSRQRA